MAFTQSSQLSSELIKNLYDALSPPNHSSINLSLDKLINEVHTRNTSLHATEWVQAIKFCCSKINQENPLLVAKCANILQVLINSRKDILRKDDLNFFVHWACQSLTDAPDIVYIDLLQMLDSLMKNEPEYFATDQQDLVTILCSDLESKASVSLPQDIKRWRINCLTTLSTTAPAHFLESIAASYLQTVLSLKSTEDRRFACNLWLKVLEGLEGMCSNSTDWVQPVLKHLAVVIHTAMNFGLNITPSPLLQFPAYTMPLPDQLPRLTTKIAVRLKTKNKGKARKVYWTENAHNNAHVDDEDGGSLKVETVPWLSGSDSEFSDSESGCAKKLKKLEAHVRNSAYNLFIRIFRVVGCKPLVEWYCPLFSQLIDCLQAEVYSKPRCAVLNALTSFLSGSKMFISQAQHHKGQSFTSFSEILAAQLTTLHSVIEKYFKNVVLSEQEQLKSLFVTTSSLIKVTPYARLKPGLFESLFSRIRNFSGCKDPYVVSCVLQCLLDVVILSPQVDEVSVTIAKPLDSAEPVDPWVYQYAFSYIDEDANGIRVFAWGVVSGMFQYYFNAVEHQIFTVESKVMADLKTEKPATPVLKALGSILEKYLNNPVYFTHVNELWDKLLDNGSPFVRAIQDLGRPAGVACECLCFIGARKFHMLTESRKILAITSVFGCSNDELPNVRASALNVLGTFLSYPEISGEIQFVCDAKDHLIRALNDPIDSVRAKAAWAFSGLIDLIVESKNEELLDSISVYDLLQTALKVSADTPKVRRNILRAVGHLLSLVSAEDLELPKWKDSLEKSCLMLQQSASSGSGSAMKMRWNACYAIHKMLSNTDLCDALTPLLPNLIKSLCSIVISCNNFKVRMNASLALSSIQNRKWYGPHYLFVWQSLLEGLDNAANMPDFSEFKHQHGLLENLCSAICHMACFIQPGDLVELNELLEFRLESLSTHLQQCQERITPEQAGAMLQATSHLRSVSKLTRDNHIVNRLLKVLESSNVTVDCL